MTHSFNDETIELIRENYSLASRPWVVGFSGGKDSSALLKLLFSALVPLKPYSTPISVLYCDTGVDIPPISALVLRTMSLIDGEARQLSLPICTYVVHPLLKDRYFVKVIGRGYPPPTNKFRWCTDVLRVDPVQRFLKSTSNASHTVLLAIRKGESQQRDRTISLHATSHKFYFRQQGNKATSIFGPIINYTAEEVWATLIDLPMPSAIDTKSLLSLYRSASGECPIVRDPRGTPCSKGRFGCWTCTVVRRDRSLQGLVDSEFHSLEPLIRFKHWLLEIRDDPTFRCTRRRNGAPGPGPFTLSARQLLLQELLATERAVGTTLISQEEIHYIHHLWNADQESPTYSER